MSTGRPAKPAREPLEACPDPVAHAADVAALGVLLEQVGFGGGDAAEAAARMGLQAKGDKT